MIFLFDSKGKHIANFVDRQLHATQGKNIGHFLENKQIFIDMHGEYLGEIVHGNRLMRNRNSPYKNINYGEVGDYGNVGNYGDPRDIGGIGLDPRYEDIPKEKLK